MSIRPACFATIVVTTISPRQLLIHRNMPMIGPSVRFYVIPGNPFLSTTHGIRKDAYALRIIQFVNVFSGDVFYGLLLKSGKAPRKVFDNIINMFGTDGETDGIRADSLFQKFLFRKLGMGRGGRMDHQALHVRHIGKQ